jgi:hypothetical protein
MSEDSSSSEVKPASGNTNSGGWKSKLATGLAKGIK